MRLWNHLLGWLRRARLERDLDLEMEAHREMIERDLLASGVPPEEARYAARRRFGNRAAALERSRELWGFARLDALLGDLRFALRMMWRRPALTIAAVLTVAFCVGANTAILSVLQAVLLNPLGLPDAPRIVVGQVTLEKMRMFGVETSAVEFRELQSMTDAFSAVAGVEGRWWTSQAGGEPVRLVGRAVTGDFFRVFGQKPFLGRFLMPEDEYSAVLSYPLWQSQFGGDRAAVGRTILLDGKPHRIVGVAPESFRYLAQLWTPLRFAPQRLHRRGWSMNVTVFARLKDGVGRDKAQERVNRYITAVRAADSPEATDMAFTGYSLGLTPLARYIAGDLRTPLILLWAAALVVLLSGCANVAGLLLSRVAGRRREMAIRVSVGATRAQILRQLAVESLLLGAAGGAAGLGVARLAVSLLRVAPVPEQKLLSLVTLDARLLLYGLGMALAAGLLSGLAPAIQVVRQSQASALVRGRRRWFQDLFVTAEVAAAFVLVVVTLLLARSLRAIERISPGFDTRQLATALVLKPANGAVFLERLRAGLASMPGIDSAALAYPIPFSGGGLTSSFDIKGRGQYPGQPQWHGEAYIISPEYFRTLRISVLRGRNFTDGDGEKAPRVCIVDSEFADRFFPGGEAMGQEISMYGGWARIVGVAATIRGTTLQEASRPVVYYPLPQVPFFESVGIVARSPIQAMTGIREAVRQADSTAPVFGMRSMEERIRESLGVRRVVVALLTVFGAVGMLLAAIGLYGVIAQVTSERTQEIGIRLALGARPGQVLAHFVWQGLRAGLGGLPFGLAAAAFAQHWLRGQLYSVKPFDAVTFYTAAAFVLSMVLVAVWRPAHKAARTDPHETLRFE